MSDPTASPFSTLGNHCGHDPQNPRLSPDTPIRKGPGGLPRILSLAAERAKEWFFQPEKCPQFQTSEQRQTRSERREATGREDAMIFLGGGWPQVSIMIYKPRPSRRSASISNNDCVPASLVEPSLWALVDCASLSQIRNNDCHPDY